MVSNKKIMIICYSILSPKISNSQVVFWYLITNLENLFHGVTMNLSIISFCINFHVQCLKSQKQCHAFFVDESKNLNSALWESYRSYGVSRTLKSSIFCFSIFGLICCFASYCGVALVNWFQWWSVILAIQWILFINSVNHGSGGGLMQSF